MKTVLEKSKHSIEHRVQELTRHLLILRKVQDQSTAKFVDSLGGLSLQELNVINIIGDTEPCIMSDIAKQASLSLSSVTVIVDKLVKAKLVKRIRSEEDRRIVCGSLTEQGKKIFQIQIEHIYETIRKILCTLTLEEQEIFLKLFDKIAYSIKKFNND